jgi:hypothetical protein
MCIVCYGIRPARFFLKFQRIAWSGKTIHCFHVSIDSTWKKFTLEALFDSSTDDTNIGAVIRNGCVDKFI